MNVNYFPIGRTGNQMFQAAAALGYARKYRCSWGGPKDTREVPHFRQMFPNVPVLNGQFKRFNRTDPSQFNYEEFPRFKEDTTLCGFFQSEKYFEHCKDEVKELFKLDIRPISNSLSIHVRRTDYVTHSNSFPPIDMDYIVKAENYVWSNVKAPYIKKVIVFSDDIQWCMDNIYFVTADGGHIEFSEGKNEFEDLSLMASCEHHVIANSTFSWWGAYLGHNPSKIIVSPHFENWFGPGFTGHAPKDLIPESWHQIKFR